MKVVEDRVAISKRAVNKRMSTSRFQSIFKKENSEGLRKNLIVPSQKRSSSSRLRYCILCATPDEPVFLRPHPHGGQLKVRDILKLLGADGWFVVVIAGSHRQMKHPTKPGRVTVSGHPSDDIHPKTLKSILTQAGLRK